MHTALLPDDAVQRIGDCRNKHQLPVLGTSFGARLWDRKQHGKILEDAELVITRLAKLGGRTLGTSVGARTAKDSRATRRPGRAAAQDHGAVPGQSASCSTCTTTRTR